MNKILNWTFGACFRTLGRFLAIFVVFALLLFVGSKLDIELPDWLSLRVNATEQNNWAALLPINGRIDYKSCTSSTNCNTSFESNVPGYIDTTYGSRDFVINTNAMTIGQNGYNIMSPITNMKKNYLYSIEFYLCSNKVLTDTTITPEIYSGWYSDAGKNDDIYSTTARMSLSGYPGDESGTHFNYCYLYTGLVVPDRDSTWANFRIRKTGSALSGVYISTISINYRELGLYNTALEEIIQNSGFATSESVTQVQQSVNQVEQEIQKTQDTITNEDTQGAEDSASGFFNDFDTNTFGLTSIITAPLNAINSLISKSCSPLILPLPFVDKNLSLPCMSSVYSQYFGGFFTLYQLITTGLISYYIIVRIFNLVKDFKNPEHDEIEVVDL